MPSNVSDTGKAPPYPPIPERLRLARRPRAEPIPQIQTFPRHSPDIPQTFPRHSPDTRSTAWRGLAEIAHHHVEVCRRHKGWADRFMEAHRTGVVSNELFRRWEKKWTQSSTASAHQRKTGEKKEFVRDQLALDREMDAAIQSAQATRIEATTGRIEATVNEAKDKVDKICAKVCPEVITQEGDIEAGIPAMTPQQAKQEYEVRKIHHRFEQDRMKVLKPLAAQSDKMHASSRKGPAVLKTLKVTNADTTLPVDVEPEMTVGMLKTLCLHKFGYD